MGKKRQQRAQSFVEGAMILLIATVVVKIVGMLYKIPLTKILGGTGMGYYMTAYGFFTPVYALTVSGLPVAVSKLVAEESARGRARDARQVFYLSLGLFMALGVLGSCVLWVGADAFSQWVGNPAAASAVRMVAPAVLFCCLQAAFRGYNEGLRNMIPTALSQMLEAFVKLISGVYCSARVIEKGLADFQAGLPVYGVHATDLPQVLEALLPPAAAGAVMGVTLGAAIGALFLAILQICKGLGFSKEALAASPRPQPVKSLLSPLIKVAIPVCLAGFAANLSGFIDLLSVMNRLGTALETDAVALLACYPGLAEAGMSYDQLPNYLYGCYMGLSLTVFNIVPAITGVLGTSALPVVAASWAMQNRERTCKNALSILRLSCLAAIPAGLGVSALSEPILTLLFSERPLEVSIAAPLLQVLGIAAIFSAITLPVNSMLQALGRADLPVRWLLTGGFLKLLCNMAFMGIPSINLQAAPYSTLLCYGVIAVLSLNSLCRITGVRPSLWKLAGKPLLAAMGCCLTARGLLNPLQGLIGGRFGTVLAVGMGALVYVLLLLLLRAVEREDLEHLPLGEKVIKMLEKLSLIG